MKGLKLVSIDILVTFLRPFSKYKNGLKMVSGKSPKYQQKRILDLSFLFTIQNVASGYTLCPTVSPSQHI